MKRLVATMSALALTLSVATAIAGEQTKGEVQQINPQESWFALDDGHRYYLGEGLSMQGLKPGTEVTVSFEEKDGKNIVSEIKLSE